MDGDASGEQVTREGSIDGRVERPDHLKRAIATTALGVGGIATVAWIVFLGWAVSEALVFKALKQWSHPSAKQIAIANPKKARMGYEQPSVAEPVLAPARGRLRLQTHPG
jgi:hypothetical protein